MRMPRLHTFLLALVVAISGLALVPALAEAQADVITGRVTREGGAAISGARIEILSVELETSRSVLTDGNGRFMVLFPDGGGTYVLRVSFLGMADQVATLTREAGEELLVRDFMLMPQAIALAGITATVAGGTPGQGQAGEQSTELSQDLLNRLPLPDLDPATLALLTAGVTATELDSLSGRMGFSVGGMSDLLNEVSLDGILLGGGDLGVPEEGVRRTQVTTSTFDVSQGGFAGGLVSLTSARGSNRAGGAFTYRFDDDALQTQAPTSTGGFRRHNFGGSWGGPILPNRLFYNVSFQLQDNTNYRFALSADDPLAAARSGVVLDSVARFLNILESGYGISTMGQTGSYNQGSGDLRLSGRVDWNITQASASSHSLTARFNLNRAAQDSTRISALDLSDRGGDTERNTQLFAATLNSRFRTNWTHRLSASYSENWNEAIPFVAMPEGRIRVASEWEDGTRTARTLTFGGNRNMPTEARSEDLQVSNELSFLQPIGAHLHRFKVGGSVQRQSNAVRATDNLFGSFSYASLADFEQNVPERYERSLTERESYTTRLNSGIFVGDTWRISQPLEVTLGLRWDHSALGERPAYNPAVENTFGRRTDIQPSATGWSPRIGFSYRLGSGSGGSGGGSSPIPGMARSITGGIGLFAGRAPDQVFSQAFRQTGLSEAEQSLVCVGSAVPRPNWDLYAVDPMAAPLVCADGGMGVPPVFSTRAPSVTLLNPNQRLPSSLRTDLGYRTFLMGRLPINLRYTWSLGMGLWGYEDLNLDESRTFVLGNDGRTFFGDPSGIVTATGATTLAGSRIHSEFGQVLDVVSNRRSSTHQLSAQVIGQIRATTSLLAAYTLGFSRDQGSAGGGLARFGGGGGGLFAPGTGSPNEVSWATASGDRRHAINLSLSHAIRPEFEVSMLARITSGTPFTPLVDRDVNGDGLRNDIAFVFDPLRTPDPALSEGMARLLDQAPSRVVDCLADQLGGFASRNSCRNGWSGSLDMRLGIRPNLPRLERRMTLSVDATNVLTGVDQLVNGRDNMRGWGAGANADPVLLYVRGFDPSTRSFRYEVNEAFGQDRRGVNALRAPFALRLSARVALGGNPAQNNRGFGQTGGGGFGGMAAFLAGMGGGGGGGAFVMGGGGGGGGFGAFGGGGGSGVIIMGEGGGFGGGGGGGLAALGALGPVIGSVLRGETVEPADLVDALLPNPPRQILALRDTLALTEAQQESLAALGDELATQHAPRRDAILPIARELVSSLGGGGAPNFAALQGLGPQIQALQPQVTAGAAETRETLPRIQEILTEAQWEQVPPAVRGEAPAPGGGRGGGQGEGRGGQGGAMVFGGGAGGSFNAVGTLDRLLANPIPVVLEFADPVGMSDAQIQRIQGISAELDRTLRTRREALGQRFDGVPAAEQIQVFQQIQPDIQRGREEIRAAMGQVREVLAPDQWNQLPAAVRNAGQQGGGGVQIIGPGGAGGAGRPSGGGGGGATF